MSPMGKPSEVQKRLRAAATRAPAAPAADVTLPEEDPAEKYGFGRNAAPPVPYARPRKEKPVRFTLDLDRARHQFLKEYTVQVEAGGASEVMRALLDELRDDPDLAGRVRARIWQQG